VSALLRRLDAGVLVGIRILFFFDHWFIAGLSASEPTIRVVLIFNQGRQNLMMTTAAQIG
jgi:hypothetical protein